MDYVRDTMDWLMGKGRRKADKEPPTSDGTPGPPYLDPAGAKFPTQFVTPALLPAYVRLPHGVDQDEWLATHTISFFEHVNLLYSCLSEYCNVTDCSSMNGPQQSQYYWVDEKGKKTKSPAACYVDFVMTFVHKLIIDESVFPTKYGNTFPANFLSLVKRAWRYLFHVIAHIYAAHFVQIFTLQLHSHLHTLFVHFSVFNKEFGLVEEEETRVLDDLLDLLLSQGMCGSAGSLPPLTTSQSDSALHNRTRVDASLCDGAAGDAWSLPPGGVTGVSSTTAFSAGAVTSFAGSAPAQCIPGAARVAGGGVAAPDSGAVEGDAASPLRGTTAAAAFPVAGFDDSFDARLSPSSESASTTGAGAALGLEPDLLNQRRESERRGGNDDDNDDEDDHDDVVDANEYGGVATMGTDRILPQDRLDPLPNEFRPLPPGAAATSSPLGAACSSPRDVASRQSPSNSPLGAAAAAGFHVDDDVDEPMAPVGTSTAAAAGVVETLPLQATAETNCGNNNNSNGACRSSNFAAHRVKTHSYSSETSSDAGNGKSRSSSGHSNLSAAGGSGGGGGGGVSAVAATMGAAASSPDAVASSGSSNVTSSVNSFVTLRSSSLAGEREKEEEEGEEEEDDKENLSPMGDLSVSAEGAALMVVENMEVVVPEEDDDDDVDVVEDECRR